ncbi:MAG: caspase family protein [Hyphomonadaceae bacterium]|nr:caspase family protein [Hyphomonadaceae bacterium]
MRLLLCALFFLIGAAPAHAQPQGQAQRRVALVIGESTYRTVEPLVNPGADANLVAQSLARAGFDVRLGLDLDKAGMQLALDDFARDAQQADIAAVYYAGHGFEAQGRNWLVPIDASIAGSQDLARAAVPFEAIARSLTGARVKLVALDACRDNPFAARTAEGGAINRGLAEVELDGYVIVYAAAVGQVALDGDVNSPFATSFARWVREPNVDLRLLAGRVRDDVMATTNGRQRPFVSASLSGDVMAMAPMPAGRVRGAASVRERPSAVFDFVRRVRDENCFETRTVRCQTKAFGLIANNRLFTIEDDNKLRVWDRSGANLQRAEAMPEYERRAVTRSGGAFMFAGETLQRIGVKTTLSFIGFDGRRTEGILDHPETEPILLTGAGPPDVAVFTYRAECVLDFFDVRTFRSVGQAYWQPPLRCGQGSVDWIFSDDRSDLVVASVSNAFSDAPTESEVILFSAHNGAIVCRIPGAFPDAAFNEIGGFNVANSNGSVTAYDARCRALRTDRLHRAEVTSVHPFDRTRMMSRSIDGVVKVWAAATGRVERELTGLPRQAEIMHISDGGGGTVLIRSEDRRLYVWTGEPRLGAYVGPSSPVCAGALSEDANTLYAMRCDGALEVWRRRS